MSDVVEQGMTNTTPRAQVLAAVKAVDAHVNPFSQSLFAFTTKDNTVLNIRFGDEKVLQLAITSGPAKNRSITNFKGGARNADQLLAAALDALR